MRWTAITYLVAISLSLAVAAPTFAANSVIIRNDATVPVQIGFDRGATQAIAPRSTVTISLGAGQHTAECRFEGGFDGCNVPEQFTLGDGQRVHLELLPFYTLQHAVSMAKEGALRVETRRDAVWATKAQDVAGAETECANYETGKLAGVSTRVRSGMSVEELTVATQQLCGEARPVVSTTIGGEKVYVQPNFLIFRDRNGRAVVVRQ
jgi:hypothetical protein